MIKEEPESSDSEPTYISDDEKTRVQPVVIPLVEPQQYVITKNFKTGRNTRFYREAHDKIRRLTLEYILLNPEPQFLEVKAGTLIIPLNVHTLYKSVKDLSALYDCTMANVSNAWTRYCQRVFGESRRWPGTFPARVADPVYDDHDLPNTQTELHNWILRYVNQNVPRKRARVTK